MSQSTVIISCFWNVKLTKKKGVRYTKKNNAKNMNISLFTVFFKQKVTTVTLLLRLRETQKALQLPF